MVVKQKGGWREGQTTGIDFVQLLQASFIDFKLEGTRAGTLETLGGGTAVSRNRSWGIRRPPPPTTHQS